MTSRSERPPPPIELQVGERCNVRRKGEPKLRLVTRTAWRELAGGLWFYWWWTPEGARDCGYSGTLVRARKKANT